MSSLTKTCHNTRIPAGLAADVVRCDDGHMHCKSATNCLRSIDRINGNKSQPFATGRKTPSCTAILKASA